MSRRKRDSSAVKLQEACERADLSDLIAALGVEVDPALLNLALTHRSYAFEQGGLPHNERLEFLGDSVLGLAITDELYRRHLAAPESDLARMRANIVSSKSLADLARSLRLGDFLKLGRGELTTGGRDKSSILADTMEAVFGAVYLTTDAVTSARVVVNLCEPLLRRAADLGAGLDWKTSLQELASNLGIGVPTYVITADGPDHAKTFVAEVVFGDVVWGRGEGRAKKAAEQSAADHAWHALCAAHDRETGDDRKTG